MAKKKRTWKKQKEIADKHINAYHEKHAFTPATPGHDKIKPWQYKDARTCHQKLHTKELKLEAFRQYCEHISKGRSKYTWYLDHPDVTLTWETFETYLANDTEEIFSIEILKTAQAHGYRFWEEFVIDCAKMSIPHDTNALAMIMRNKYKWDRQDTQVSDLKAQVSVLLERMKIVPANEEPIDVATEQVEIKPSEPIIEIIKSTEQKVSK